MALACAYLCSSVCKAPFARYYIAQAYITASAIRQQRGGFSCIPGTLLFRFMLNYFDPRAVELQ